MCWKLGGAVFRKEQSLKFAVLCIDRTPSIPNTYISLWHLTFTHMWAPWHNFELIEMSMETLQNLL